jgi:hypothetical protein
VWRPQTGPAYGRAPQPGQQFQQLITSHPGKPGTKRPRPGAPWPPNAPRRAREPSRTRAPQRRPGRYVRTRRSMGPRAAR